MKTSYEQILKILKLFFKDTFSKVSDYKVYLKDLFKKYI